jgi:hypothetical protein
MCSGCGCGDVNDTLHIYKGKFKENLAPYAPGGDGGMIGGGKKKKKMNY